MNRLIQLLKDISFLPGPPVSDAPFSTYALSRVTNKLDTYTCIRGA
jgi:hypothetical protein